MIKRFPTMPFTLRALAEGAEGDAKQELSQGQLRLGLVECLNHGLLHPYPVLHEKGGDLVAQVWGACVRLCVLGCVCWGGIGMGVWDGWVWAGVGGGRCV